MNLGLNLQFSAIFYALPFHDVVKVASDVKAHFFLRCYEGRQLAGECDGDHQMSKTSVQALATFKTPPGQSSKGHFECPQV